MRFLLALIVAILCLQAYNAVSQDKELVPTINHFKDWQTLTAYLKQQGIEPTQVGWAKINPMCLSLSREEDKSAYNRCRYEKVLLSTNHTRDQESCRKRANLEYPNFLRVKKRPRQDYVVIEEDGMTKQVRVYDDPYSKRELENLRALSFEDCMADRDWINSERWEDGRRAPVLRQ